MLKSKKKQSKKSAKSRKVDPDAPVKVAEKEVRASDVKLFRIMPFLALLGAILIVVGFGGILNANHIYSVKQGQKSFSPGTQLPLFRGESKGTLKMGNIVKSKDNKQAAVEIKYTDQNAKTQLSVFGKNYKLYVLTQKDYPSAGLEVKYGFFGTDGSGILQISSPEPFIDQAIVIMLIDESTLVSSNDIYGTSNNTDSIMTKSITAQLADGTASDSNSTSSESDPTSKANIPIYYLRVNPGGSAKKVDDWGENDKKLVEALFVNQNLEKIEKNLADNKKKLELAKNTLREYDERLKENPDDKAAATAKQTFESNIETLNNNIEKEMKNYDKVKSYRIKSDILGKQQTKYKLIKSNDINKLTGQSYQ